MSQSRKYKQSQTLTTDLGLWGASPKQVVQKDNFKALFFQNPLRYAGIHKIESGQTRARKIRDAPGKKKRRQL